jgi:mRNA-degrading endonuclease toxin of MazEF toxin-antitoxin module
MKRTQPGEIWRVDFGLAAKIRPALILSDLLKYCINRISRNLQVRSDEGLPRTSKG